MALQALLDGQQVEFLDDADLVHFEGHELAARKLDSGLHMNLTLGPKGG